MRNLGRRQWTGCHASGNLVQPACRTARGQRPAAPFSSLHPPSSNGRHHRQVGDQQVRPAAFQHWGTGVFVPLVARFGRSILLALRFWWGTAKCALDGGRRCRGQYCGAPQLLLSSAPLRTEGSGLRAYQGGQGQDGCSAIGASVSPALGRLDRGLLRIPVRPASGPLPG